MRGLLLALGATLLWLVSAVGPLLAQDDAYPGRAPSTTYESPRTFEHAPPPAPPLPPPMVVVPGSGHHKNQKPDVIVPAPVAPGPEISLLDQVIAEFGECLAHGERVIVPCLRQNHDSVMIRRLEACLRSEQIPDDPAPVRACLSTRGW